MKEMKCKAIFKPHIARALLKMGNPIVDIKPLKEDEDKAKYYFEITDKFQHDLYILNMPNLE